MNVRVVDEASRVFADPTAYADERRLQDALTHLRQTAPVSWVDVPGYRPFWAITKHADIMAIERADDLFTNSPRPVLTTTEGDEQQAAMGVSTLIHMDDPQHRKVRAIGADWFRPKAMRALKVRVDELAKFVDQMADRGGECDFVTEVAVNFPLYVIMSLLGIPESDFPRMLTYTQELFGSDDAELQRGVTMEERGLALFEMFTYFNEITAARTAHRRPGIGDRQRADRRRAAVRHRHGVLLPHCRHRRARHHQRHHLGRTAGAGGEPGPVAQVAARPESDGVGHRGDDPVGHPGQGVHANRTAGQGDSGRAHRCGGVGAAVLPVGQPGRGCVHRAVPVRCRARPQQAHRVRLRSAFLSRCGLARMEVNSFFSALLPRLKSIELAGTPEHTATIFVGGLKHLPIRYELSG